MKVAVQNDTMTTPQVQEIKRRLGDLLAWRMEAALTAQLQLAEQGVRSFLVPEYALGHEVRNGQPFTLVLERMSDDEGDLFARFRSTPVDRFPGVHPGDERTQSTECAGEVIRWEIVGCFVFVAGDLVDPTRGDRVLLVAEAVEIDHLQEPPC